MNLWTSFFMVLSAVAVSWPFLYPGESGEETGDRGRGPERVQDPLGKESSIAPGRQVEKEPDKETGA